MIIAEKFSSYASQMCSKMWSRLEWGTLVDHRVSSARRIIIFRIDVRVFKK